MCLNSLTNQYVSKQTKLQAVHCYCCCCCVCQSILHPLDESAPVYSCYVIPNTAQGKNLSYLFCSFQQTNSTAVHRTDFSRKRKWPPHLHKATFNDKADNFLHRTLTKRPFSGPQNDIKGVKFVVGHSYVTFWSHKPLHYLLSLLLLLCFVRHTIYTLKSYTDAWWFCLCYTHYGFFSRWSDIPGSSRHLTTPPNNRPNETQTNVTAQGNIHMKTTRYQLAVT